MYLVGYWIITFDGNWYYSSYNYKFCYSFWSEYFSSGIVDFFVTGNNTLTENDYEVEYTINWHVCVL